MAASKINSYRPFGNGKYQCLICDKKLSTRQRVLTHLQTKHDLSPLKRERKLYLEDETVPVPRSTKYFKQSKARKVMDPKGDCCNLKPAPQPPANLLQHELHDTTSICESTSNEEDTAEVEAVPVVHCSALLLPMKSENCYSDVKTLAKNSDFSNDKMGKYEQSDEEHNETNSVASCDSSSESDTDDESKCSSIMTSTESNDSEDENEIKSSRKPTELPAKDYQALSLMSCFLRNKFSKSACEDVIDTYKKLFSSEDVSSLNYHDIMSRIDFSPVNDFHYCSYCNAIFPEDRNIFNCPTPNCNGLRYKGPLAYQTDKARQPTQSFVFADVKTQLHTLLETTGHLTAGHVALLQFFLRTLGWISPKLGRKALQICIHHRDISLWGSKKGIWKDILETKKSAFERFESGSSVLTDITDGSAYRAMMTDDGFLNKTSHNLTAIFNTDGVNLFSSSKIDLWPIFLAINELSPPKRFARENIILAGLWQVKGKPPFTIFFSVFVDQMNTLFRDGIQIEIDGEPLKVCLSVVCCIADLPAKAELLNMSYFNGPHACIKCDEPGLTVKQGRGSAKCYPYKGHDTRCQSRKQECVLHHMQSGTPNKRSCGFKGISALASLQNYDIVSGTVPEYMHGVLLGATKTLLSRWFAPSESKKDYFIGQHLKQISHRLKNLKPPEGIERLPRDLEKHYNHFKATELQSWLLYYAYPCVKDFLKDEYLENFSLLSEAVHILLRDSITHEELVESNDLLDRFYASFQRLYGDGSCGLNIHNIGYHLPEYVQLWGPLWAWSAFPFEDANSALLQAVHGTGTVLKQVMKHKQIQSFIRRKGLNVVKKVSRKITHNAENCGIVGAAKLVKANQIEDRVITQLNTVCNNVNHIKKAERVIVNQTIFYSEQYSRMHKRICSVVMYGYNEVGSIKYFILCDNIVYAVIQKMQQTPAAPILGPRVANHYSSVRRTDVVSVIDVVELKKVLVYLNTSLNENTAYVVSMPNRYGHALFK